MTPTSRGRAHDLAAAIERGLLDVRATGVERDVGLGNVAERVAMQRREVLGRVGRLPEQAALVVDIGRGAIERGDVHRLERRRHRGRIEAADEAGRRDARAVLDARRELVQGVVAKLLDLAQRVDGERRVAVGVVVVERLVLVGIRRADPETRRVVGVGGAVGVPHGLDLRRRGVGTERRQRLAALPSSSPVRRPSTS